MSTHILDTAGNPVKVRQVYKICLPDRRELSLALDYSQKDPKCRIMVGPANSGLPVHLYFDKHDDDPEHWKSGEGRRLSGILPNGNFWDNSIIGTYEHKVWIETSPKQHDGWGIFWYPTVIGGRNFLQVSSPDTSDYSYKSGPWVREEVKPGYHALQVGNINAQFEVEFVRIEDHGDDSEV